MGYSKFGIDGGKLRETIADKLLTPASVAREMGVTPSTLHNYIYGQPDKSRNLDKLRALLGVLNLTKTEAVSSGLLVGLES
jgi:transcriptional regulator with XRE-family HTH domain